MATYRVETWDSELGKFTPQEGVPAAGLSLFQLRQSLRMLKSIGYSCDYCQDMYGDPSVSVEREESNEQAEMVRIL